MNGNEKRLFEKDLYCIARHISEFIEASKYEKIADDTKACYECKYALNKTCTEAKGVLDPWPSFFKLSKATGVPISAYVNQKKVTNV